MLIEGIWIRIEGVKEERFLVVLVEISDNNWNEVFRTKLPIEDELSYTIEPRGFVGKGVRD